MRSLLLAAALLAAVPAAAQAPAPGGQGDTSPFRTAGRFFENCDARADADGQRPPENYGCLSYMAGLVEGYSVAAYANGNKHPYCLPRPVTLVEMMDMLAVSIERGVPPETPTAVVLHNSLTVTFPCGRVPGAAGAAGEATVPSADAAPATEGASTVDGGTASAAPPAGETGDAAASGLPIAPDAPVEGAPEGVPTEPARAPTPPAAETPGTGLPAAPGATVEGAPEGDPAAGGSEESPASTDTEAAPDASSPAAAQ